MRLLSVSLTVALTVVAAGCSKSPDKIAQEAREAAASWAATLSAAAEWWGGGEVSTSYVQTVVTQAHTSLHQEEQTARTSAGDAAAAPVRAVAAHAAAIADAVKRGDRAAAIEAGHAAASEVPVEKTPAIARPE
jgi:hypothetical protein